jgi:hypothetical protein
MAEDDFQASFAALEYQVFDATENMRKATRQHELLRGREYWKGCLFAVLALLLAETALAWFFGRKSE